MTDKSRKMKLLSAWCSLLLGTSIYLLFRSRNHLGFVLLDTMGMTRLTDMLRSMEGDVDIPDSIRYNLPDGLWVTSYILFSDYANRNSKYRVRLAWVSAEAFCTKLFFYRH